MNMILVEEIKKLRLQCESQDIMEELFDEKEAVNYEDNKERNFDNYNQSIFVKRNSK